VCFNASLELGSMLPQIEFAKERGIPVLVMNPNQKSEGLHSMNEHCNYVWEQFVLASGFQRILVLAHSAGGGCVSSLMNKFG
jgi:predicted aldo/keto reductase-like oxidoreductase